MQAIVQNEFGPPERLEDVDLPSPEPQPNQVLVQVDAAGVGFVDGLLIQGLYQVKPPLPYHPGSEFAGTVLACGSAVTQLRTGQRVFGLANGTFSEQICVVASQCMPTPDSLSTSTAAGFAANYATALFGLRDCGALLRDETVLILGASGGVGSAAICVAKAMGATVIAAASTQEKLNFAQASGADAGVNYSAPDWRKRLQALLPSSGLNMVYDPVGGDLSETALRNLSPGGRHLVVGFAAGTIGRIPLNLTLLKRCSIVGVDWGGAARQDSNLTPSLLGELLRWFEQGNLKPHAVTERPMSDVRAALADQLQGQIQGKLVLTR